MTVKKVKKRPDWSRFSKPHLPSKPQPPQKEFVGHDYMKFATYGAYENMRLGDLHLPMGVKLEDVFVTCDAEGAIFSTRQEVVRKNSGYEVAYKDYLARLAKWEKQSDNHSKEVVQWKEWVKQEEQHELDLQLKQAENLLKKHGKLK